MLPGEAAEQDGDSAPFLCGERTLHRLLEVLYGIKPSQLAEPHALRGQPLVHFLIQFNVYEFRCHSLPPAWGVIAWVAKHKRSVVRLRNWKGAWINKDGKATCELRADTESAERLRADRRASGEELR